MGKPPESEGLRSFIIAGILVIFNKIHAQDYGCPPQDKMLPCRCSTRDMEFQIWCSHSELPRVLEGLKSVSRYISHPVGELILENNNLPSLPGHVFANLRVLRLMLRNNRLERVSSGWLEGLHDSLLELFLVEPDLRSLPVDSLENLQGLEAITLQSKLMKRLPSFTGLSKLRYLQINSASLLELIPRNFRDLPSLEQFHVFGSPKLIRLEAGLLRDLPRLQLINVSDCGIHWLHPRTFINLPELKELTLSGNLIQDSTMISRTLVDLPSLSVLQLDKNKILHLTEGSFVNLPSLSRLSLSYNRITEIFPGALKSVPLLRVLNLNHNRIRRIHTEFYVQHGREHGGIEEMWLMDNDINHVSEIRSVLDALPRLKFLEASNNQIQNIDYGAFTGHSSLERLHLDYNRLAFLQRNVFTDMPALRELKLRNNSLTNSPDIPFWNLPALKGLDLSGNFFRHVESSLLENLPNLRRLDLSHNAIALVEPNAFLNLPLLEHVNISGNDLSVLHPLTFQHLTNLYELDIGWNRLLEIIPGLPRNMEHLYLPMNRIIALPSNLDSQLLTLPMLRSLDLSANGIERLPPGALGTLSNLRKLNLGFNALTILEDGGFEELAQLEVLDLRYNRIGELQTNCLRPLMSLLDLNLRGNRIELFKPDVLEDNTRLQRLDISRNNFARIPQTIFDFTRNRELRELYASHNVIPELPSSLHGLESLQILDFSFNKLTALSSETLGTLKNLLELKLVRNRIRELREGIFDKLPRLTLIDLENNDLVLIERNAIRALPELQTLKLGKNRIQTIPNGAFSELFMLQSAELQENRIQEIANNAFINVPHLLFLNLSHNLLSNLEQMGLESLRSLEVLDVSDNRIMRVSSESLATMEWLVELKMDNNQICAIQGSPFDDMPRLRVLSLRSNKIASIAENAFKRLRSNIAVLDIDGNPLSCSCGMLWLRGWLQQASFEGPRCADGSLFREIRLSKQDCQRKRQLEPIHSTCESETLGGTSGSTSSYLQNINNSSSWLHMKKPLRLPTHDSDDMYDDYDDYSQINSTDFSDTFSSIITTSLPTTSSIKIITPQPIDLNIQTSKPNSPFKSSDINNNTKLGNSTSAVLKSPSNSGFTFFGMPLSNIGFNLWGNSGKKANRKDDISEIFASAPTSSISNLRFSSRPDWGRYRNFPPTEPEIHRGGFIPLPRGQSGFIPIQDIRLEQHPENTSIDVSDNSKNLNVESESGSRLLHELKQIKTSNYNLGKIERTNGPLLNMQNQWNPENIKFHQSMSGYKNLSSNISTHRQSSSSPMVTQDSIIEADETLVSTEIYNNERIETMLEDEDKKDDEMMSKILWTSAKSRNTNAMMKGILALPNKTLNYKNTNSSSIKNVDSSIKITTIPPVTKTIFKTTQMSTVTTKKNSNEENIKIVQDILNPQTDTSTLSNIVKTSEVLNFTPQLTKSMEASALSALLIPGGQLPPVALSSSSTRFIGKSTITKIPSPYFKPATESIQENNNEKTENILSKEDNHLSGSSVDETVKLVDDDDFNWYFQHYNNSDLESYVGIAYGGSSSILLKVDYLLLFIHMYYLTQYI